eukprot:scaffold1401_cov330-Pavlova_lutheri.AAC.165
MARNCDASSSDGASFDGRGGPPPNVTLSEPSWAVKGQVPQSPCSTSEKSTKSAAVLVGN